MSHTISKTKIMEGPTKAIFHFYFESDGQSSELDGYVLLDPVVDFDPEVGSAMQMTIQQMWHSLVGFDLQLAFDALVEYPVWTVPGETSETMDFTYFGGLKDRADTEHNGQLYVVTNGLAGANAKGTLVIEVKKN